MEAHVLHRIQVKQQALVLPVVERPREQPGQNGAHQLVGARHLQLAGLRPGEALVIFALEERAQLRLANPGPQQRRQQRVGRNLRHAVPIEV